MSCGVGCRRGLDLALLCPWHRAVGIALIQPLAWELPYAVEAALKRQKKKKKKRLQMCLKPSPVFLFLEIIVTL